MEWRGQKGSAERRAQLSRAGLHREMEQKEPQARLHREMNEKRVLTAESGPRAVCWPRVARESSRVPSSIGRAVGAQRERVGIIEAEDLAFIARGAERPR